MSQESPLSLRPGPSQEAAPSSTEVVTESSESHALSDSLFAHLIPLNHAAQNACSHAAQSEDDFHKSFTTHVVHGAQQTIAFVLDLSNLPDHADLGWRIGTGNRKLAKRGVEFLLSAASGAQDDVSRTHARFSWMKGAGGFFVTGTSLRRTAVNGAVVSYSQKRAIPFENAIEVGECLFHLRFVQRDEVQEDAFLLNLRAYMKQFHGGSNPLVVPTPSGRETTFGDWFAHHPIAQGSYGTVFMATHRIDGRPAAIKQLLMRAGTRAVIEREVKICRSIMDLSDHASPSRLLPSHSMFH